MFLLQVLSLASVRFSPLSPPALQYKVKSNPGRRAAHCPAPLLFEHPRRGNCPSTSRAHTTSLSTTAPLVSTISLTHMLLELTRTHCCHLRLTTPRSATASIFGERPPSRASCRGRCQQSPALCQYRRPRHPAPHCRTRLAPRHRDAGSRGRSNPAQSRARTRPDHSHRRSHGQSRGRAARSHGGHNGRSGDHSGRNRTRRHTGHGNVESSHPVTRGTRNTLVFQRRTTKTRVGVACGARHSGQSRSPASRARGRSRRSDLSDGIPCSLTYTSHPTFDQADPGSNTRCLSLTLPRCPC